MKPRRWVCSELRRLTAALWLLAAAAGAAVATGGTHAAGTTGATPAAGPGSGGPHESAGQPRGALEPAIALVLPADAPTPPPDAQADWRPTTLPDSQDVPVAWYRVPFDVADPAQGPQAGAAPLVAPALQPTPGSTWMLYLPYFYGGGQVWLNGVQVAAVTENSGALRVRWERPLLLPLPTSVMRAGTNVLHVRAVSSHQPSGIKLPRLVVGPQAELQPQFDRRLFLVRTVPVVTVVTGVVVGLLVLFIWLRRRQEAAYGLFGLAALLWAVRTSTFVFDALPASVWPLWRALYYASTGGFIAVLALFTLSLAGWFGPRLAWALLAYVVAGPAIYLAGGAEAEDWVGRWWVLGLVPIGAAVAAVSFATALRTRTLGAVLIAAAVALAFAAGVHDYAVAWSAPWLEALLPRWAWHRLFMLHHAANLLLIVMGGLLTARFVRSLHEVEAANAHLQQRVAERERELAAGYERIALLQREQATQEERQRIMQELHDGLGSQLFSALMRSERGALDAAATSGALRAAIDEMRVAIEALAGDDGDLRTAFGNFRFRWDARLRDAGLVPRWEVDLPEEALLLPPHDTLQLLRVAQEALTNVLKHAHASHVTVRLRHEEGRVLLDVADDGRGLPPAALDAQGLPQPQREGGRGLANMHARAERLQAQLTLSGGEAGTRVALTLPLA